MLELMFWIFWISIISIMLLVFGPWAIKFIADRVLEWKQALSYLKDALRSPTAKTRALKANYSLELAQDLKAVHGLNAEAELSNILAAEILDEIDREVVRTVNTTARVGSQTNRG